MLDQIFKEIKAEPLTKEELYKLLSVDTDIYDSIIDDDCCDEEDTLTAIEYVFSSENEKKWKNKSASTQE